MAGEEVLERLVKEKLEIQRSGIRQRQYKTGQSTFGLPYTHHPEVSPVDLSLFSRKHLQTHEDLAEPRSFLANVASELLDSARVPTLADHREDTRGAKTWMLFQRLLDELPIGFKLGRSRRSTAEPLDLQCSSDRVVVKTEFGSNGADSPVFGVIEPTDLNHEFRGNHHQSPSFIQRLSRPHLWHRSGNTNVTVVNK